MVKINVRNEKTWKGNGFYVGRPSSLSNPFIITENQDREKCIYLYGKMIISAILKEDPDIISSLEKLENFLLKNRHINLICHCHPSPCHANIIKQLLTNKFFTNKWLISSENFDIPIIGVYDL